MKANDQIPRKLIGPALALLLLAGAVVTATPSTPTLAAPPDPTIPQPEPFYIRLEQPLTAPDVMAKPLSVPVQITANPGEWYNLDLVEQFENTTFPPADWQIVGDSGWHRWDGDPRMDLASAGITNTSTTTSSWLVYGPTDELVTYDIANAKFSFSYWLDSDKDVGWFGWAASSDGQGFYGARVSGSVRQWLTGELDMTQYLNDDSVWVAFFFLGGGPGNGVYVDNVTLQGVEPFKMYLPAAMKNYSTMFTFTDNFSDSSSGWPHKVDWGSSESEQKNIRGYSNKLMNKFPDGAGIIDSPCRQPNRYFMRVGNPNAPHVVAKAPVQATDQFIMEVDIAYCDAAHGASTGVVFGLNDAETQFYRVILIYDAVDGSIRYAIWRDSTQLVSTSGSTHLKGGYKTNHVKVVRDGCTISVYFNDHLERTLTNQCHYRDQRWVGLFHDRYSYFSYTGSTAYNFRIEGALEPTD